MTELDEKIAEMDAVLAGSTCFDRFLMDRAMGTLKGLDLGRMDQKMYRKLERVLVACNHVAKRYPAALDPTMPLPATALVEYAHQIQNIRALRST